MVPGLKPAAGVMVSTLPLTESWLELNGITLLVLVVSSKMVMLPKLPNTIASLKVIEMEPGGLTVESSVGLVPVKVGAVVSTFKENEGPLGLVLPATSVWVALRLWAPSKSGVLGVKLQLPFASAVALPIGVEPS